MSRPQKMTSGDEFLDALLTQAERTNELLDMIVARLPVPDAGAGSAAPIDIREPEPAVPAAAPVRIREPKAPTRRATMASPRKNAARAAMKE